ncbi:MAG: HAD-IA family hydrolase [Defluviitaleaceae bacterium]|nr:HAD-IA family hydrolase [Defluviitaleaceae bacterium]
MIKAVLFDFDGVLTLDENGTSSICNYICRERATGICKAEFEYEYRKYNKDLLLGKLTHEDVWDDICGAVGQDLDISILHESFIYTPINFDMIELVRELKEIGLAVGVVTDNKSDRIKSIIDHYKWHDLFDGIVVSADVGSGKTSEAIFHEIFKVLSVNPEECIFIDNTKKNLEVLDRLGVTTIWFEFEVMDVSALKDKIL